MSYMERTNFKQWLFISVLLFFAILLRAFGAPPASHLHLHDVTTTAKADNQDGKDNVTKKSVSPEKISLEGTWKFKADPEDNGLTFKWNMPQFADANWKSVAVPGYWNPADLSSSKKNTTGAAEYAWYRFKIKIPASWTEQTVFLHLGKIADLDWAYLNGELIGHIGDETQNPKDYERIYAIPSGKYHSGKDNLIAVRVYKKEGPGGIWAGPVFLQYCEEETFKTDANTVTKNGDIVMMGNDVNIPENQFVKGDVVSIGGNVRIDGAVQGDVVCVGGNIYLGPKARVGKDTVTVGGHLDIQPGAVINGQSVQAGPNISYFMNKKFQFNNNYDQRPFHSSRWGRVPFLIGLGFMFTLIYLVIVVLLILFVQKHVETVADKVVEKPLQSFAVGMTVIVMVIPASLMLLVTCIGIPFIPLLWMIVILGWILGVVGVCLALGRKVNIWNIQSVLGLTLIGLVILRLIHFVPCLGWVIAIGLETAGLGAVVLCYLNKDKGGHYHFGHNAGPTGPMNPPPYNPPTPPAAPVMNFANPPTQDNKTEDTHSSIPPQGESPPGENQ